MRDLKGGSEGGKRKGGREIERKLRVRRGGGV